jgi:hypothetical protein
MATAKKAAPKAAAAPRAAPSVNGGAYTGAASPELPADAQAILDRAQAEGELVESGEWIKLADLGRWVCGMVLERREGGTGKVKDPYVRIRLRDGSIHPMGLGGNLIHQVTGELVGEILTVMYVNDLDVGKQSPMKCYKVIRHGETWPSYADDLPF